MKIRHQIWNAAIGQLHRVNCGRIGQEILLKPMVNDAKFQPLPYRSRELLEALLPLDFETESAAKFSAGIISSVQEIELLPLSTEALLFTHGDVLIEKILVAPKDQITAIKKVIPGEFKCISDDELLSADLSSLINTIAPLNRQGWIRQQLLKILLAKYIGGRGTLLVDADTILLRKQNWISENGIQNLQISAEYHRPYQCHFEKFANDSLPDLSHLKISPRTSFVTHHQLMQPSVIDQIFTNPGQTLNQGLRKWIEAIDFSSSESPACEWHTYGTFLAINDSSKIQLTQWRNIGISRNTKLRSYKKAIKEMNLHDILRAFEGKNSISLHHYIAE
jgi:hypothetical protein